MGQSGGVAAVGVDVRVDQTWEESVACFGKCGASEGDGGGGNGLDFAIFYQHAADVYCMLASEDADVFDEEGGHDKRLKKDEGILNWVVKEQSTYNAGVHTILLAVKYH